MFKRMVLVALLGLGVFSCAANRFKVLAGLYMNCSKEDIVVTKVGPNQWIASGCGEVQIFSKDCRKCPWLPQGEASFDSTTINFKLIKE